MYRHNLIGSLLKSTYFRNVCCGQTGGQAQRYLCSNVSGPSSGPQTNIESTKSIDITNGGPNTSNLIETTSSLKVKTIGDFLDSLAATNVEEDNADRQHLTPLVKELYSRNEPELRDDIFEDSFENYMGERVPIPLEKNKDEMAEDLLPSEKQEVAIKLLHRQIKTTNSYEEALRIYTTSDNAFFIEHHDTLLRVLSDFIMRGSCNPRDLMNNSDFNLFAKKLCKVVRRFDTHELVTTVKFLSLLRAPEKSVLSVTIFQVIRSEINEFSVGQLAFLHNLIKSSNSKLQTAIKNAIPVLLEISVKNDKMLAKLTAAELAMGLSIAVENVSLHTAENFLVALFENEKGLKDLGLYNLTSVVMSLLELNDMWKKNIRHQKKRSKSYKELRVMRDVLLKEGLQISSTITDKMKIPGVIYLLKKLSFAYSCGDSCAYNQNLLDNCAQKVINENQPLSTLAGISFLFQKMNRIDESLLEFILLKVESSNIIPDDRFFGLSLLNTLPSTYISNVWSRERLHSVIDKIINHEAASHANLQEVSALGRVGIDLACLGYFKPSVIEQVLEQVTARLRVIADRGHSDISKLRGIEKVDFLQYLQFFQSLRLLDTKHSTPEVDERFMSMAKEIVADNASVAASEANESLVKALLQDLLCKYEHCLVTGLYTPNHVPIDYALVIGPDGALVPQTEINGGVCTSKLNLPLGAKVLAIIEVDQSSLFNGSQKPRSRHLLRMKLLSQENVTAMPILLPHLGERETDKEKFQYLTAALLQHGVYI